MGVLEQGVCTYSLISTMSGTHIMSVFTCMLSISSKSLAFQANRLSSHS